MLIGLSLWPYRHLMAIREQAASRWLGGRAARAGGLPALRTLREPADVLRQTKERLFAA